MKWYPFMDPEDNISNQYHGSKLRIRIRSLLGYLFLNLHHSITIIIIHNDYWFKLYKPKRQNQSQYKPNMSFLLLSRLVALYRKVQPINFCRENVTMVEITASMSQNKVETKGIGILKKRDLGWLTLSQEIYSSGKVPAGTVRVTLSER